MNKAINYDSITQEFLFLSYFGVSYDKLNELKSKAKDEPEEPNEAIKVCFDCAYKDFNRTLRFNKDKNHDGFVDEMYSKISREKAEIDITGIMKTNNQEDLNRYHEKLCNALVSSSDKLSEDFCYGQAQKWINMTLKYMYLTGIWKDDFSKIEAWLHVPIDSYILSAVFANGKIHEKLKNKGLIVGETKNLKYKYTDGKIKLNKNNMDEDDQKKKADKKRKDISMSWSKIPDHDVYEDIQDEIKKCIPEKYKDCPLQWENEVWMSARNE